MHLPDPNKSVLIVEDDMAIIELLTDCLEADGFTIISVSDGQQAVDLLLDPEVITSQVCLILLDLMLPIKTGREIINQLNQIGNNVPVVAMSASRDHLLQAIE